MKQERERERERERWTDKILGKIIVMFSRKKYTFFDGIKLMFF